LIVVKASVSEKKSNWKELVFEIGLIAVFLAVKNRNGQEILLDTLLLILGAKEIASEKLIRVYTVTIATALFVTIGASLLGIIENLSYAQPGRMTRMAFGIGYPTDFGAHVLFLLLCYFYLRRKKIQYVELAITVLIGGLIYIFCGARTNALCIWLLAGVLFYTKIRRDDAKKRKKEYEMASWFSGLLASAGTICAAGILILSMLYTKGSSIFLKLDSILSQRLSFSQKGMEVYGFSIFGQYIPMQGNGGSTETPLNYFFLDSSYISILLQYGLIMFVMILILWGIIGLRARKEKDWVYIDWADMDKDGPLCAEQMLYAACFRVMAEISEQLGKDGNVYRQEYEKLTAAIEKFFWDEEKGAYIDSFTSGKRNVTRHANIFAILFDIADKQKQEKILTNVLENDEIPAITTPYFNFFELDVLCQMGKLTEVLDKIRSYWGGMLDLGAVTFWEEYDPSVPKEEQYDMYGDHFGKSLCHAWAASPIYFLAKYFAGLDLVNKDGVTYVLKPQMQYFTDLDCTLPVGSHGTVRLIWDGEYLDVTPDADGGVLELGETKFSLVRGETRRVRI